jgi:hypothetical protein
MAVPSRILGIIGSKDSSYRFAPPICDIAGWVRLALPPR